MTPTTMYSKGELDNAVQGVILEKCAAIDKRDQHIRDLGEKNLEYEEEIRKLAKISDDLEAQLAAKPNMEDYAISLQQAIEEHCHGRLVAENGRCPHYAEMLNYHACQLAAKPKPVVWVRDVESKLYICDSFGCIQHPAYGLPSDTAWQICFGDLAEVREWKEPEPVEVEPEWVYEIWGREETSFDAVNRGMTCYGTQGSIKEALNVLLSGKVSLYSMADFRKIVHSPHTLIFGVRKLTVKENDKYGTHSCYQYAAFYNNKPLRCTDIPDKGAVSRFTCLLNARKRRASGMPDSKAARYVMCCKTPEIAIVRTITALSNPVEVTTTRERTLDDLVGGTE